MQRLIDADKLKINCFCTDRICVDGRTIENAPTVKAITVDWIDGYIKRRANDAEIYAEILFISDMVKEWERENEESLAE